MHSAILSKTLQSYLNRYFEINHLAIKANNNYYLSLKPGGIGFNPHFS